MTATEASYSSPLSVLEIHLDRVRRNCLFLQKMLSKGTDLAAVVKADAYGLGAGEIAATLHAANCRHFYVATAAEGLALRTALGGREAQIYVLHGPHGTPAADILRHGLVPVLNTPGDIEHWAEAARKAGRKLPAALHLDTGMNRLGLSAPDVKALAARRDRLAALDIRTVMSHLACADEPAHPHNSAQLQSFTALSAALGLPAPRSFANSAGIFLGRGYHFDQVRPGAALYGINPQPATPNPMQGVVTLRARILQIREAAAGETVGYGASYRLASAAKLATISAGYADGLLRSLTGRGVVHVHGRPCPLVGRVSMDAVVAEVTQVAPAARAGDWAEILGAHQDVDAVAAQAGTIGYEILTALGKRYSRLYSGRDST